MASPDRQYELVLLGATGYTGKLTAEHITTHLPTDLRWAVAGRSAGKLEAVVEQVKHLNPDRLQPEIEVTELSAKSLDALAKKTKLIITVVGPYALYGAPVVEACAKNGTHYLDVTAETPWVLEMIKKYDSIAKQTGAIMIPQIGIESAPADLGTWCLVSYIREKLGVGTKDMIFSVETFKSSPSGGTLATFFCLFEEFTLKQIAQASDPWALSPVQGIKKLPLSSLLGVRSVPGLGYLSTSISALANRSIVHRTWGLMEGGNFYGKKFHFEEYMQVRSLLVGVATKVLIGVAMLAVAVLPPLRWFLKKLIPAAGTGAEKEYVHSASLSTPPINTARKTKEERLEYHGIAIADLPSAKPQRGFVKVSYDGGLYYLTGVFLAEAAITILRDETLAKRRGGGLLTPAFLGQPFVDRLAGVGFSIETKLLDN
ncbi:MAG: hypothetical protein M1829_001911 [Trizodia sp. TS-e1964]|nr:MAG: hypothetical protein M1829_001911 [Trizodia sp. TS-e1964]